MKTSQSDSSAAYYLPLIMGLILLASASLLHKSYTLPDVKIDKQQTAYNFNQNFLRLISTGNKRLISNTFWILTLMESDQDKYHKNEYANWMYLRFLNIAALDPLFYENYLYGGMYLSVIKDDLEGAAHIFELGLEKYPQDYQLNYYAGFNYFFEMGDFEQGLKKLERIRNHPRTPDSLKRVINRLEFVVHGDYETAITFLEESYAQEKNEIIKNKLRDDIYSLKIQRDLDCLNQGKSDCNRTDPKGIHYQKNSLGEWSSIVEFREYKIFRYIKKDK